MQLQTAWQMLRTGRLEQAQSLIMQVLRAEPDNAEAHAALGALYVLQGQFERAIGMLEKALALNPDDSATLVNLGAAYQHSGAFGKARECYCRVLSLDPGRIDMYRALVLMTRYTEYSDEVRSMETHYASTEPDSHPRRVMAFALGKVFDDLREFDKAFEFFSEANAIARREYRYSLESEARGFEIVKNVFDREYFRRHRNIGISESCPIFVTGLPRSGTTLIEQVLASHPDVFGGGELPNFHNAVLRLSQRAGSPFPTCFASPNPQRVREAATQYVTELKSLAGGASFVTDKNLGATVYIGLISVMLPNAKIIYCQRDPRDQGLSLFQRDFEGAQPYCYDLRDIARYSVLHQRMLEYWQAVLPGRVCSIRYEALVAEPEVHIRRLLDHCGLAFDPACVAFHETKRAIGTASFAQVREPIHKGSIGRWKNYASQLQPLFEELDAGTLAQQ